MEPTKIEYATVTRQGDEKYLLDLQVKLEDEVPVDTTVEIPETSLITSLTIEGDVLIATGYHRDADAFYAEVITHLKRYDIIPRDLEPPILSAKPEPLKFEPSLTGPRRSDRHTSSASN